MSSFLGLSLLYLVVVLFINKTARMPQSCTGCKRHLAVWCHCYSAATIALGLCITCLRCRDVKVCWNCKKEARRRGSFYGGCCDVCASFRRCSKCNFFEYAPGLPSPGCVCPRCQASFVQSSIECPSCGLTSTRMTAFIHTWSLSNVNFVFCWKIQHEILSDCQANIFS